MHVITEYLDDEGAPNPTPPSLTEAERRDALRKALEVRATAAARRDKADAAAEKAEEMLTAAKAELAGHASLDAEIAKARADAIASSLTSGAAPDMSTPPDLAALSQRRGETANKIAAIETALAQLDRDADAAEVEFKQADREARLAALDVMSCGAAELIDEMLDLEQKSASLRRRIASYRMQRKTFFKIEGGQNDWLPLTAEHHKALGKRPANATAEADAASTAAWRAAFDALLEDADAPFELRQ